MTGYVPTGSSKESGALQWAVIVCEPVLVKDEVEHRTVDPVMNVTVPVGNVVPVPVTVAVKVALSASP
jgi:hypothetical protein